MGRVAITLRGAPRSLGRLTLAVYAQATTEGDAEAAEQLGDSFMGYRSGEGV